MRVASFHFLHSIYFDVNAFFHAYSTSCRTKKKRTKSWLVMHLFQKHWVAFSVPWPVPYSLIPACHWTPFGGLIVPCCVKKWVIVFVILVLYLWCPALTFRLDKFRRNIPRSTKSTQASLSSNFKHSDGKQFNTNSVLLIGALTCQMVEFTSKWRLKETDM